MSEQSKRNWYLMYVRSRFEKKVHGKLTEQAIPCYLPLRYVIKQWHDRKKKVLLPVFPGYVFVCASLNDMIKIYDCHGFVRFVSTGHVPDVISDQRMSQIMKVLDGNFELLEDPLTTGDSVIIESGPLIGLEGILVEDRQGSKFVMHLNELNKYVIVDSKLTFLKRKLVLN